MSEHVANTIADCEGKIAQLTDLVEKLRWFQREFPHTAAAVERRRPRMVKAERGRPRAADRKPNRTEPSKPRAKAPRSLPNVSEGSELDRVLAVVQHHVGRCRPREIIAATKFPAWKVSTLLKALEAKHLVTRTGFTVQLAGAGTAVPLKPNTPAPAAGNGHAPAQAAPAPAGVAMVEARNLALKTRIKQGPATFAQLLEAMPEERDLDEGQRSVACMRTVRRLLIKREIREVGDTYRTV